MKHCAKIAIKQRDRVKKTRGFLKTQPGGFFGVFTGFFFKFQRAVLDAIHIK